MRTLIANGTIVTADGSYAADVLVDGERSPRSAPASATRRTPTRRSTRRAST